MKKHLQFITATLFTAFSFFVADAQQIANHKNPKIDLSLSPANNKTINPSENPAIHPKTNWNINPGYNKEINPSENVKINPKKNEQIDPMKNLLLNPMLFRSLHPKNETWSGQYLFDKDDNLTGYITRATKDVLICFDIQGIWTCYYVLTPEGNYNHFEINGVWTGGYLCSDNKYGFNAFDKDGNWTGQHIK
jgi:hypothetical protein